ncbi:YwqG family protein [Streptomyces xanthii]|uniref:DUF1963 domain-containing protein n=1 Tax=Streptomyces xanthii TaxID=2768069 RepID=A0A7H1BDI5_9ACTN|nr:hypothetical protein [Streptomyces xanthii]QNS06790.1 hypothetical protein IAG42_26520 [Streptomyces xanthii]
MSRTTPPRPFDAEALFPGLAPLRRTATRLHPRPGSPTARDSSVGGPMLWPTDEPWPVCPTPHKGADRPLPLIGVAQLYRRDVPGLPHPELGDVLQVFWCTFEGHTDGAYDMHAELRRRHADEVTETLAEQPVPDVVGRAELVPDPCVLHPEEVTEYPWFEELSPDLQERVETWEEDEGDEDAEVYVSDLSTAPGWKSGGHIAWNLTGPTDLPCTECGTELFPLLTATDREWDSSTTSWIPYEDRDGSDLRYAYGPTGVRPWRSHVVVATCPGDPRHPLRLITQ